MRIARAITPLLWRVIALLGLFVTISGIIGPRIIDGGIVFRDGFAAYGGLGKALIFGLIAFMLIARHNKAQITLRRWQPTLLGWIVTSGAAFTMAWISVGALLAGHRTPESLIGAHGGLLLSLLCAAIGCFGLYNMRLLWHTYKRAVVVSVLIATGFYVFLHVVYMLWQPLAALVLLSVHNLLEFAGPTATIVGPHTLMFDKFGITVSEYCSGIESIALFSGLYVIVGLLDWKRLYKQRYFALFPFALLMLSGLNIVRVYGLILAGYYINPHIAFSLFHTYAGLVFFIVYSAVFWAIAYRYLLHETPNMDREAA